MIYDLQRAMIWKRISAWLFDAIMLSILSVGIGFCLSSVLQYDSYTVLLNQRYEAVAQEYKISPDLTEEAYQKLAPEKQQAFIEASKAIAEDQEAQRAYSMILNLSIVITSLSVLCSCLILEFGIPALLKNGQTLGKKIFSIGVMATNGVRVKNLQMFIRTVLGKYTIELMVPLLVGTLSFFGSLGIYGTLLIFGLGLIQLILISVTRTNALIHDLLAGTVVIDMPSQMIFETESELLSYKEKVKKDLASRQEY